MLPVETRTLLTLPARRSFGLPLDRYRFLQSPAFGDLPLWRLPQETLSPETLPAGGGSPPRQVKQLKQLMQRHSPRFPRPKEVFELALLRLEGLNQVGMLSRVIELIQTHGGRVVHPWSSVAGGIGFVNVHFIASPEVYPKLTAQLEKEFCHED